MSLNIRIHRERFFFFFFFLSFIFVLSFFSYFALYLSFAACLAHATIMPDDLHSRMHVRIGESTVYLYRPVFSSTSERAAVYRGTALFAVS